MDLDLEEEGSRSLLDRRCNALHINTTIPIATRTAATLIINPLLKIDLDDPLLPPDPSSSLSRTA
eukprot:CAMPEP_0118693256 /NCGR_PEP_ID=MMETSP0800-20121206/11802_1 /TAXON_ID=210618 ORGANISM="Striatella unipunctata, Strain CCMP2910" /NCGR_SAMPLE_ID=MMETSP0800 /ASSEMBLY_ACC=CAM_ASM_000638 /LENGTH=64 /DNA_ID=CAMNT_0006591461 /DNA_START=622 /DNA_END=816 /DNA_ORIENTATION=-